MGALSIHCYLCTCVSTSTALYVWTCPHVCRMFVTVGPYVQLCVCLHLKLCFGCVPVCSAICKAGGHVAGCGTACRRAVVGLCSPLAAGHVTGLWGWNCLKCCDFCGAALVSGLELLCGCSYLCTLLLSAPLLQGPGPSLTHPREQSLSQPETGRAAGAGRQPACLSSLSDSSDPHPAATSPPISGRVCLGVMCLSLTAVLFPEQWGIGFPCPGKKPCPSLLTPPPPTAKCTCRCVCCRALACAH